MALTRKAQLHAIATDDEMLATPLLVLCIDTFGTEFFEWEPATFDLECAAHFGTQLSDSNRDKVWALVSVLTTDLFYKSLETFIPIANVLNGAQADFDTYDPVTGEEAAWAITEVFLVDPPGEADKGRKFSHEIRRYIGETLRSEGITAPPAILAPHVEYDIHPEEQMGAVVGPDPDFLHMYETRQAEHRAEIEQYVADRGMLLTQQLQQLPLINGNLDFLAKLRATAAT